MSRSGWLLPALTFVAGAALMRLWVHAPNAQGDQLATERVPTSFDLGPVRQEIATDRPSAAMPEGAMLQAQHTKQAALGHLAQLEAAARSQGHLSAQQVVSGYGALARIEATPHEVEAFARRMEQLSGELREARPKAVTMEREVAALRDAIEGESDGALKQRLISSYHELLQALDPDEQQRALAALERGLAPRGDEALRMLLDRALTDPERFDAKSRSELEQALSELEPTQRDAWRAMARPFLAASLGQDASDG